MIGRLPKRNILIVDDEPANIDFLGETLLTDYEISVATNGYDAFEIAVSSPPELILLDVMMPEMDGYEVCKKLKADKRTTHIPVIFITAKNEIDDETRGLDVGAVDFITKPVNMSKLSARIKTHLEQKKHRDQLEKKIARRTEELIVTNDALKESIVTIREAKEKLILTEKMATLGGLVAGATHEINTPLGIAITAITHLMDTTEEIGKLFNEDNLKRVDLESYLNISKQSSQMISSNLNRAADLIRSFKIIAVDQCSEKKRCFKLKEYIDEILLSLNPKLRNTRHRILVECHESIELDSYPGVFSQIVNNLIMNSLTHGFENIDQGEIRIKIWKKEDILEIKYSDNGKGVNKENLPKIFDPYFTTKRKKGGSGLGMHIVYNLITKKLNGKIECESKPEKGVVYSIQIPNN